MGKTYRKVLMFLILAFVTSILFACQESNISIPVARFTIPDKTACGNRISLNGSASTDPEGSQLIYSWSVSYRSDYITLDNETAQVTSFIPKRTGTYNIQLIVTNSKGKQSVPIRKTLEVEDLKFLSIAPQTTGQEYAPAVINWQTNAGPDAIYFVHHVVSPQVSILLSPDVGQKQSTLTKILQPSTKYPIKITMLNNGVFAESSIVEFTTKSASLPHADAGSDKTVNLGSQVILNGTGSSQNSQELKFKWTVKGPDNNPITLTDPNSQTPSFVAALSGLYHVLLEVEDGFGKALDEATITTSAILISNLSTEPLENSARLNWQCSVPASYEIFVTTTASFPTQGLLSDSNSYLLANIDHGATYHWYIKAHYGANTAESDISTFTTPKASWEQLGLTDQAVNCLFRDKNNRGIIYAGTKTGFYETQNGGLTFSLKLTDVNVTGIALEDPNNGLISTRGNGILRLVNGTWLNAVSPSENISTIGISSNDPNIAIAPTLYDGVLLSVDGGKNFRTVYSASGSSGNSLIFTENGIYLAANTGIVYSLNGITWSSLALASDVLSTWCLASWDNKLFYGNDQSKIYHLDSQEHWSDTNFAASNSATTILPVANDLVYAGTYGSKVYRYNGSEWELYSQDLTESTIFSLLYDGQFIYAGTPHGIWRISAR